MRFKLVHHVCFAEAWWHVLCLVRDWRVEVASNGMIHFWEFDQGDEGQGGASSFSGLLQMDF
eukprot:1148183-Pelagomonas_calceolata.AAC.5